MKEKEVWAAFTRFITGLWMTAVLGLLVVLVGLLWDIHQRETFIWHDETLVEAISRLDEDVAALRVDVAQMSADVNAIGKP